jgi:hypothetical protein
MPKKSSMFHRRYFSHPASVFTAYQPADLHSHIKSHEGYLPAGKYDSPALGMTARGIQQVPSRDIRRIFTRKKAKTEI